MTGNIITLNARSGRCPTAPRRWLLVITLLLAMLLSACGPNATTPLPPTPTATAIPASATPEPPTPSPTSTAPPTLTATTVPPSPSPTPSPSATPTPKTLIATSPRGYSVTFEPAPCPVEPAMPYTPVCGTLIVPENRAAPDGPLVRLPVMIFKSTSEAPRPDPVIYLTGGGGVNQLEAEQLTWYQSVVADVLKTRDFIFYNQRGATLTEPALACPGYEELVRELAGQAMSWQARYAEQVTFWLACQDDLLARGIDLTMYTSAANAADADDLRVALGYEQANYYGTSYGTRLGLTLIRDYPEGVRSIILDSVYPPQINYYSEYAGNAVRAFDAVFAGCHADEGCNRRHPHLETTFYQVVDALNREPETFTFTWGDVIVDGSGFMEAVYLLLYNAETIPDIPVLIDNTHAADLGFLRSMAPALAYVPDINLAAFYSIQCYEETPFDTYAHTQAKAAGLPAPVVDFYTGAFAKFHFDLCASWRVAPANAIEQAPVTTDVPALVLAGQFDPITPPAWGRSTAEALPASFFYEFPGLGHGVMRADACGRAVGLQFIDNPLTEPDTSCIQTLPAPAFK